jgi:sarcosine oxidase / L-pipecolate oxidase
VSVKFRELKDQNLLIHFPSSAFKFLPVLGKYIADCYEDKAPQELRHKWRFRQRDGQQDEQLKAGDGSRAGPAYRVLTPTEQAKL